MNEHGICEICGANVATEDNCTTCSNLIGRDIRALADGVMLINGKVSGQIVTLNDRAYARNLYYANITGVYTTEVYLTKCEVLNALNTYLGNSINWDETI